MSALLVSASACAAQAPAGPAWPKPSAHETDGGQSLAPRPAAAAIAAAMGGSDDDERSADQSFDELPASTGTSVPAGSGSVDRSGADPAAQSQPDEVQGEDIVIEVED